jgi:protocatechuate 3,4-dioxygenase beta subunit
MKMTRQFLLVSAASVLMGFCALAQTQQRLQTIIQKAPDTGSNAAAQKLTRSGTVTDAAGNPLAGATVEYWRYEGRLHLELKQQSITGTNGVFEFPVSRTMGFLLARKPGMAPAWKRLGQPFNPADETEVRLVLTPPAVLAGVVVDEANKPVANAEVSVAKAVREISPEDGARSFNYFTGKLAHDCFAAHTDAAGRFRIENFPTNATATLAVQSPGKALRQSPQDSGVFDSLPYRAGQEDIKLVVEPAGSIEGKIIAEGSNQPPPVAQLTLQPGGPGFFGFGEREPVPSGADGVFHISDVAAGSYQIQAVFGTNAVPEWVADAVPVSVEVGKITRGVQVAAAHGGLVEVVVLGKNDRKPQKVGVNAFKEGFQSAVTSDSNGIALLRLPPGDYQVSATQSSGSRGQASASVETGRTNRVEIEIAAPKKITGIVRQPDGKPAAGASVQLVGGNQPPGENLQTDANGKFEVQWNRRQFGGQNDSTACILVRDVEHNLAVAQDLDEDTTNLDLKLAPGLTLAGRAECDGKPVTNATARLVFWTGRSGAWLDGLAQTNTPGQFEIPALPPGRKYGVVVSAPGYGQKQNHNLEISSEAGRQELDPVELKLANLKLAGQVLDADDKPVAGANVNLNGDGQPSGNARTDREGRFHFEHVCEGPAQISANNRNSFGNISAEGGDTNVVLRLGQTYNNSPGSTPHKLKGIVTDADGKPVAGAQVAVFPNNGTRWIKTGTNGQYNLTWSLQPWQAQNGGAYFVVRDPASNLAAVEALPEETTNLDVKLKPALTLAGQVKNAADAPMPGAQVGLWFKAGNSYEQVDEQLKPANAEGRYEIKCLPTDGQYMVYATAKGYGKSQRQIENDSETNRLELEPFVLKLADRVLAGQVLNENDKPASGVNVQLNGEDQPDGFMTTDSQGRFHFQVCEGQIRLFAYSQNGGGNAQATVEAGDTNVVLALSSQPGNMVQTPHRASLKGSPLPDLATVNLASDTAPAGKPVLLCLFDAGQRPSRHVVHQLDEQAAALRQQGVTVLGVQATVASDETFNEWKSASPVSFPVGRVTEKSDKTKWVASVSALPWLILTDADHRVIAEGFLLDELDAQIKKMAK